MKEKLRLELTTKINNLVDGEQLNLSEDEIKYMITRWIQGNWNNILTYDINFYHYSEPNDPLEKEKIGTKVSLVKTY